jgi:hypothetical protein
MASSNDVCQSYLLRMWRESLTGEWRASVRNVVTCESHFFSNLSSLFEFLMSQGEVNSCIASPKEEMALER